MKAGDNSVGPACPPELAQGLGASAQGLGASEPTRRIFVAVPLPMTLKRELALYQGLLLREPRRLRIVKPDLFHITLHFFGDLDPTQLDSLAAQLPDVAAHHEHFPIEIGGVSAFPGAIVVPVITGRQVLVAMGLQVRAIAATLGLPSEGRAINPHVTLARLKERGANPADFFNEDEAEEAYRWTCQSLVLYESQLGPGGSTYTELARYPLCAPKHVSAETVPPKEI